MADRVAGKDCEVKEIPQNDPMTLQRSSMATVHRELESDLLSMLENEAKEVGSGLTCGAMPIKQRLCLKMLTKGKPTAFIEFFQQTHTEAIHPNGGDDDREQITPTPKAHIRDFNSKESLSLFCEKLMAAEVSTRLGDFYEVFEAIFKVANLYEDCGDYEKSVFYLIRCLDIVKKTCNRLHESKVKLNLGRVCMKLHDSIKAKTALEQYLENVTIEKDSKGVILGSKHLLEVYKSCAQEAQKRGDLETSIAFYEKAILMAEACEECREGAESKHQIGILYVQLGQPEMSLKYHKLYLDYCCKVSDKVGESKAHAALGEAYESLGDFDTAIYHLDAFLKAAESVDLKTQARACCKLGMIYNKQKQMECAAIYFEKFFHMACTLNDPKMIDAARINLGFVRSYSKMNCNSPKEESYELSYVPP